MNDNRFLANAQSSSKLRRELKCHCKIVQRKNVGGIEATTQRGHAKVQSIYFPEKEQVEPKPNESCVEWK